MRLSGIVSLPVQLAPVGSNTLARPGTYVIANRRVGLTRREVSADVCANSTLSANQKCRQTVTRVLERPRGLHVSIRSPHRSEGRSLPGMIRRLRIWVSIRSPHRSEGRYVSPMQRRPRSNVFQSAPPTEVRGDMYHRCREGPGRTCFNPLPPPK